jgi:hypothetical protein
VPRVAAGIAYLDGPRLRRSLIAAADWVEASRDELNRINVFPVPDGDTGTNFTLTLRAVAESVRSLSAADLPTVTRAMADACVCGARGNSGMLLSHFLIGFRDTLGEVAFATPAQVARAIRAGADRVYRGLDEPVEGTILTVCREAAEAAEAAATRTTDFREFLRLVLERAESALARTTELLAALRDAGVVDAGAKGFVRLLEGIMRLIDGDPILAATEPAGATPNAAAFAEVAVDRDYRYCTEALVRGTSLPPTTLVRTRLRELGGSIVVLATDEFLKLHIHTNAPDTVFGLAAEWGAIEFTKAEDMREQHRELHQAARALAVVTDSTCDLPDDVVDAHGLLIVPVQVLEGERVYQDRVEIQTEQIYARMAGGQHFTTSQPTPGAFMSAFGDALNDADRALGVFLAGSLSGTFASAQLAARTVDPERITTVDSRTASLGLGLLTLRAAELARDGWAIPEIAEELSRVRDRSSGLFTLATFEHLLRSGRVGRGRAWLGTLLDIKPILEVGPDGRVLPLDRVRGSDALVPRVLEHLDRRLQQPRPKRLRLGVVHAAAPAIAERLRAELVRRYRPEQCLVSPVTAAIGVHIGPGAWGVFYQIDEPGA